MVLQLGSSGACDVKRGVLYVGRRAMEMEVQLQGKRGRPKRRWKDRVRGDIKDKGLSGGGGSV